MEALQVLEFKGMPIYKMLSLEEHLLNGPNQNYLLINYGSPPAVVLGKSNILHDLVTADCDLPLIRRFSGGGTVVIDPSTVFITFLLSREQRHLSCVDKVFDWSIEIYQNAHPHLSIHRSDTDYAIGDKKVGGTAQYVKKDRILHHTSFLFDYTQEHMNFLKHPQKAPTYRAGRNHKDFLTTLSSHFRSIDDFLGPIKGELKKHFFLEEEKGSFLEESIAEPKQTLLLTF